ncbi:hypothetical protein SMICM304S_08285 [Streptomyces microflavus]
MPIRSGSAEVFASAQSMTAEASAMSGGPATSIFPPESQKPREV